MLDIKFIKENEKLVKDNLKKKFQENLIPQVDKTVKLYDQWLKLKKDVEDLRHRRNIISQEINELVKTGKKADKQKNEAKQIPDKIKSLEEKQTQTYNEMQELLLKVPNIIHKSVPIGKSIADNKVKKTIGKIPKFNFQIKNHVELAESLGVIDFEASAKTSGNGFYYLKNELALLNQALIQFAINHMVKKKYTYIETPLMLNEKSIFASMDKETIENSVYDIQGEDLHLIGTSEQSLLAMHSNQTIKEEDLPKKYFSYSMCFRKEIGSHGINEKGLWRTHQFNKVEQFVFCRPEDSYKYYDELLKNTEEIFQKLKLPYRVLEMCSADLAPWKSKSADVEVYRPTTKQYEEVASLSNCTDYQARKLNTKVLRKNGTKEVLHTLNNTVIATSRAMVAILENYQQKNDSIKIPAVLLPYMCGIKVIKKLK
ncbi:MAG: serine--tRNA ligase [Candidatus Woesearchaeota archaeon]|nr:MAG: serine--tRNA ligase [Candidatus Woesearchaeota archaeon]